MNNLSSEKELFKNNFRAFLSELKNAITCENGQWTIKGFIDVYKNIYTISSDTKIISKILEIHLFPLLQEWAHNRGYKMILADKQNYYPDLTFEKISSPDIKFAVDLKTTFRRGGDVCGFTLGSHGTYFIDRNSKKNIQFPYKQYKGHFCLGIVYSKGKPNNIADLCETQVIRVSNLGDNEFGDSKTYKTSNKDNLYSITSVIRDFDFFFSEKWKIASDSQGSGNTANIGSISNLEDIKNERGVFSLLGEEYFDLYWLNYNKTTIIINGKLKPITSIWEFLLSRNEKDKFNLVGNGAKRAPNF